MKIAFRKIYSLGNSPFVAVYTIALLYAIFLFIVLQQVHFDWSYFIFVGDKYSVSGVIDPNIFIHKHSMGYDGQFYYKLAQNPLTPHTSDNGVILDLPLYRQQRLMYPLLVFLLSFGHTSFIPFLMIFLNYAGILLITYLASRYVKQSGHHALFGILFGLYGGFLLVLYRDLTEIVEIVFILLVLNALKDKKLFLAGTAAVCMVLARESSMVFVLGLVIGFLLTKAHKKSFLVHFSAIIAYSVWHIYLISRWSSFEIGLSSNTGFPFLGVSRFVETISTFQNHFYTVWFVEFGYVVVNAIVVLISLQSSKAFLYEKATWILYGVLLVCLTNSVWIDDWAFMRIASALYVFGMIITIQSKNKLLYPLTIFNIGMWFYIARDIIAYRLTF